MISFINIAKNRYKQLIPESQRWKIRNLILNALRTIDKKQSLKILGILVCRDYFILNAESISDLPKSTKKHINPNIIIEEQEVHSSKHLPSQINEDLNTLTVRTETVLLDIKDVRFILSNNHLIDPSVNVLGGYNTQFSTLPISKQLLQKTVHWNKTIAYLSDPEPTNYYHWMCGTLPLLRFYRDCDQFDNIDFFYVGSFALRAFHIESLRRAGIRQHQILHQASTADRIVAAISSRFMKFNDPISKEAYEFSRALFSDVIAQNQHSRPTRIYVARGSTGRRRVVNEFEVNSLLRGYGCTTVQMDGKSIEEQAQIFAAAQVVVAPHGAALTNLLFIQPGTKVIEIFPDGYINNCFYTLASYGGADYYYLLAEPIEQLTHDSHALDIKVDIEKLDELCKMAFIQL